MPRPRKIHFVPDQESEERHLVISHSQGTDLWSVPCQERDELDHKLEFIVVRGGKVRELVDIVKREVRQAVRPTRITALLWQNSISVLSDNVVSSIIKDLEEFVRLYPLCKVALPTMMYVPDLEQHFRQIQQLNCQLDFYQECNGMTPYYLHKVGAGKCPTGLYIKPRMWSEWVSGRGKGYHLTSEGKQHMVKVISKFHRFGFDGPPAHKVGASRAAFFNPPEFRGENYRRPIGHH